MAENTLRERLTAEGWTSLGIFSILNTTGDLQVVGRQQRDLRTAYQLVEEIKQRYDEVRAENPFTLHGTPLDRRESVEIYVKGKKE